MESIFDYLPKFELGLIIAFILSIIAVIIYVTVIKKSNFECQHRLSDGTCVSANCPPDESWSFYEQKCVPRPLFDFISWSPKITCQTV